MTKESIIKNAEILIKASAGKSLQQATAPEAYRALSRAVMADIADKWNESVASSKKRVGYLSAEFLIGRSIYSNLFNLGVLDGVKQELLPRNMVIHRLTGDGPRKLLLAPLWSTDKKKIQNDLYKKLKESETTCNPNL